MTIKVGDTLPSIKLQMMENGKVVSKNIQQLFSGKRVVLFAIPGAFTPTCSELHLPGYLSKLYDFKRLGVDLIACVSVNDAFVMQAWAKDQNITNEILMLADGSAVFTKALGLEMDLSKFGMGIRSTRYAMVIEDNVIKVLNVEKGGDLNVSKAEVIMDNLAALSS